MKFSQKTGSQMLLLGFNADSPQKLSATASPVSVQEAGFHLLLRTARPNIRRISCSEWLFFERFLLLLSSSHWLRTAETAPGNCYFCGSQSEWFSKTAQTVVRVENWRAETERRKIRLPATYSATHNNLRFTRYPSNFSVSQRWCLSSIVISVNFLQAQSTFQEFWHTYWWKSIEGVTLNL